MRALLAAGGLLLSGTAHAEPDARAIVSGFLSDVRSGRDPDAAANYFAAEVAAHQLTAEGETVVIRSPADYARHIREFLYLFGPFELTVDELLADNDRVYVRWTQRGHHLHSLDGEIPSGRPLVEITSVVYRVADGRIVEYWLQTDRKGLELQLK